MRVNKSGVFRLVWRGEKLPAKLCDLARKGSTGVIWDLSAYKTEVLFNRVQEGAVPEGIDLKIAPEVLGHRGMTDFLVNRHVMRVWCELHPHLLEEPYRAYLDRASDLTVHCSVVPVTGSVEVLKAIGEKYPRLDAIALKGNEASGFVGEETIFSLYAIGRKIACGAPHLPGFWIYGGVATPEAAASFLCTGAAGIVFESVHWLTDLASVDESLRRKIKSLRPSHTELVGLSLGVPCRLFNKGNSRAVKGIRDFAGKICGAEQTEEQRKLFAERILNKVSHPLESAFSRDEVIPLGVEAAFAASFVRRFGSATEDAIERFRNVVLGLCADAESVAKAFVDSPVAKELGTIYPFIQGAMTWISDAPEFARAVADAGGLPTIALGLMDRGNLEQRLGKLPEMMGNAPYAVNMIALRENPFLDEQLNWICEKRPPFAVIAAGEPGYAGKLTSHGIEVLFIAPNEELLKMAFESGIRYVICEGNESGGHVGQYSTMTFAQIVLDLKSLSPSLFAGRRIILAGGICDRETAFMAAMLGADAIQMGTVYLTTKEIVSTGALSELYQRMILGAEPGGTTITGESTGLRIRSLKTLKINAICDLERRFISGKEDEAAFRAKMEMLAAGSLLIAARGRDRDGKVLDQEECRRQGQFMSGACAGILTKPVSLRELHQELAAGPLPLAVCPVPSAVGEGAPVEVPKEEEGKHLPELRVSGGTGKWGRQSLHERIAITGMSVVNSLGQSPEEVWQASVGMRSGITLVPPSRWNHDAYYHPKPQTLHKTYCKVGAFHGFTVSRKDIGIPPQDFRSMTYATKMTLWLAGKAIETSGILKSDIPPERVAILVSQNAGEVASTLQDVIIRGSLPAILTAIKKVVPLTPDLESAIEHEVLSGRLVVDDTTLLGRLNSAAAGFISNKFGFMGPSYAVSTACATALTALFAAVQMIHNGIADAAVVGGGEEPLTPLHFIEFSAIGALAGYSGIDRLPAEMSRPFDADRDGMVLGEGGGVIVIERESAARRRGAPIYGYITSVGASNNSLGMVESSRISQEIAIRASFEGLNYGPESVDMVECHATSTRQGDVEEVLALKNIYGRDKKTVLASFKSQIGHTLGASGINSLIRGVMAMNAGVYPPTLNYVKPDPAMGIEGSGITICREPEEWKRGDDRPRRFQTSAFGFGGSNYVIQLEESLENRAVLLCPPEMLQGGSATAETRTPLPEGIFSFHAEEAGQRYRIAVVADSASHARASLLANQWGPGTISTRQMRSLERQGIFIGSESDAAVPLAFVFPGQGSFYKGMGQELYERFPVIREWIDRAQKIADFDLIHLLFHADEETLKQTRWQQPAIFALEYAIAQYLLSMGAQPAAIAGHSVGEITALCVAGVFSYEDGFHFFNRRALSMDKVSKMVDDPGIMIAVRAPLDVVETTLAGRDHVYVCNINSPSQVVIGGRTEQVRAVAKEFKQQGYPSIPLRVSMAFHTPILDCIHEELRSFLVTKELHPPRIPVISNTTMRPFPSDVDEIRKIMVIHTSSTVHWMQNVQTLWDDFGVRTFVEAGPRDVLSDLIPATIEQAECLRTCIPSAECSTFRNTVARLYAKGSLDTNHSEYISLSGTLATADQVVPSAEKPAASPMRAGGDIPAEMVGVIQREIDSFMIQCFGRFVKPNILATLRREGYPDLQEKDLDRILSRLYSYQAGPEGAQTDVPSADLTVVEAGTREIAGEKASAPAETGEKGVSSVEEITEAIVEIIMQTTGYERDEIEADMDLREDLSIRSSRLPVIMDAIEGRFGIKIRVEDFMDVRTIRDISGKIAGLVADKGAQTGQQAGGARPAAGHPAEPQPAEAVKPIERIIFSKKPLDPMDLNPVEVLSSESVALVCLDGRTDVAEEVSMLLGRDYGCSTMIYSDVWERMRTARRTGDAPGSAEGISQLAENIAQQEGLAGVVFVMGEDPVPHDLRELPAVLQGVAEILKVLLEVPTNKFIILTHKGTSGHGIGWVAGEGILGMFLSAAREYRNVHFRVVRVDAASELRLSLREALNTLRKPMELLFEDNTPYTLTGARAYPLCVPKPVNRIARDDVIVFTGGGYGITSSIARALALSGCKIVLLGRTVLDEQGGRPTDQAVAEPAERGGEGNAPRSEKAKEITRTLAELRSVGADAFYMTCDVTSAVQTQQVFRDIQERHGKIKGIVHGAGVIRDSLLKHLSPRDFSVVVDTKFTGAVNVVEAVKDSGIGFFICLSSISSILGNPGQVNYSAANRAMAALMPYFQRQYPSLCFKALVLPPIEGTGMAANPEVKALMERAGVSYIHERELAELFFREISFSPCDEGSVMFMRTLPEVECCPLLLTDSPEGSGELAGAAMRYRRDDFPLVDSIDSMDLVSACVSVARVFSHEKDLWIEDHKPFTSMKHPALSAVVMIEILMEASRILYPHLEVRGVKDAKFLDLVYCPPAVSRLCTVSLQGVKYDGREAVCSASLGVREISPSGRPLDRVSPACTASVVLGTAEPVSFGDMAGFPVRAEELDGAPMNSERVLQWYETRSALKGRYRVLREMEGSGPGVVRGYMIHNHSQDFSDRQSRYVYPLYLLEAVLQTGAFYMCMRDENEQRQAVPVKIGELLYARTCAEGEKIVVESRILHQDDTFLIWDARCVDASGQPVMVARSVTMQYFAG